VRRPLAALAAVAAAACILASLGLGACSDDGIGPGDDIVFPDTGVSYMQHVQPLLTLRCALSGCHDDQTRAGNARFTSYLATMERAGMVRPGDAARSLLYQRISSQIPHDITVPMIVTTNQIIGVKTWIDEGAKYN
jgi:hypothetical protein